MVMAPIRNGWEGTRGSYLTPNNVFLIGQVVFPLVCQGTIVSPVMAGLVFHIFVWTFLFGSQVESWNLPNCCLFSTVQFQMSPQTYNAFGKQHCSWNLDLACKDSALKVVYRCIWKAKDDGM